MARKMRSQVHKIVIVGFGSIGQAILPLLREHFPGNPIHVLERELGAEQRALCARYGVVALEQEVLAGNYVAQLEPLLREEDFLLNLATSVSTCDLIGLAQSCGAFYLDTCIDPWVYETGEHGIQTSNYDLREQVLKLRRGSCGRPTAVVAHGANPGFVSILLKQGLLEMAREHGVAHAEPRCARDWASLARALDVRVVQVSERDAQASRGPRREGEFVCTWSVDGLVTECLQPAELGWGTHEPELPAGGRGHDSGSQAGIWIDRPSFTVRVKSWSPNAQDFDAYVITHNEALSIADFLTLREGDQVRYRPTAYYAYRPCDETVASFELLAGASAGAIRSKRILKDEIVAGIDELGVFLISGSYPSLWLGSNLSIGKARSMAEQNNATSLQVVSSAVAAMKWALANPREGIVESEDLDHGFIYEFTEPYWAPIVRRFTRWTPRAGCTGLAFRDFLAGA
jgi:homospermidine synthase